MASLGKLVGLTDAEYRDLEDRVDRFHDAWKPDGTTDLEAFLPPPGTPHRGHVLVEMVKTDMGLRIRAGLPIRVEPYLDRFRGDIPADAVPVSLVAEEFTLRRLYKQGPNLKEYQARFPTIADSLAEHLRDQIPNLTSKSPRTGTVGTDTVDHSGGVPPLPPRPGGTLPEIARPTKTPPPAAAPPKHDHATDPGSESDTLPADVQYKLGRRLGKGTFGEVFEATAPGGFRVAVKRILRAVDHPASQGEIDSLDAMKAMSHPFLIQTHAYWIYRDRLVIVMELAEGSLADRIEHHKKQGRTGVPPEELIPIFEQAAEALDYLHSQNVSHRDVKPENLLLLKGYAKVADFGLARLQKHQITVVGMEVGTPSFMAPEVWQGRVSLRSDQYSLAGTYVAARLGRPVFAGKTMHELCYQHLSETPNLDPLPPAERQVLCRALAKKPEDRYPTCAAFLKDLRAATLAPPRPWGRWAAAAVVGGVLLIGMAVGLWGVFGRTPEPTPTQPTKSEPPPPVWSPPGWVVPPDAETHTLANGLIAPARLTRTVGGQELTLVLITPTRPEDPPAFYMLRDKVTNRVFRTVWEQASADPNSRLSQFIKLHDPAVRSELLPGKWRAGAAADKDGLPVVGVTAPETMLVAAELGGQLPTYQQWRKAVGANGDGTGDSPAGKAEQPGEVLADRPLALGVLDGPWPVTKKTVDESVFGIHQLTSNGFEWADGDAESQRVDLLTAATRFHILPLTGETWETPYVLTFRGIATLQRKMMPWTDTSELTGFRVVVTPSPR